MKTKCKMLSLAAMLAVSPVVLAQQGRSSVGDLQGYGENAYFAESSEETAEDLAYDDEVEPQPADTSFLAVASQVAKLQPVAYVGDTYYEPSMSMSMDSDCGCGQTSCGGGCSAAPRRRIANSMACQTKTWLTAEALLWFPQARSAPALVTRNAAGDVPELSDANTASVFGGQDSVFPTYDAIDGGMSPGFRIDGGRYITDNVGIGGRFWWMSDNETDFAGSATGTGPSLGRPFFDTDAGLESSILLGGTQGTNVFEGDVAAETSLSMYGAEAYARLKMLSGNGFRTELIGGYSHFGIDDELTMRSRTIQTAGSSQGTTVFQDALTAENRFHGGQLGLENVLSRGGWTVRSLTKVHMGNMNQLITGVGSESFTPPTPGLPLSDATGGVLAIQNFNNERDDFAFIPELNLKLGYQFRRNIALTVGYSFLYFNNVATVGENINNVYNRSAITFPAQNHDPALRATMDRPQERSLWVQGIDLGAVIEF